MLQNTHLSNSCQAKVHEITSKAHMLNYRLRSIILHYYYYYYYGYLLTQDNFISSEILL